MNTGWLDRKLTFSSFVEAHEAIEKIVLTIPDACEERFVELVEDEFHNMTWEPMKRAPKAWVFCGVLFMSYTFVGFYFILTVLGRDLGLIDTTSDLFVSAYGLGLFGLTALVTKFIVKKVDDSAWDTHLALPKWEGNEHHLIEAARKARKDLFIEIGRDDY